MTSRRCLHWVDVGLPCIHCDELARLKALETVVRDVIQDSEVPATETTARLEEHLEALDRWRRMVLPRASRQQVAAAVQTIKRAGRAR